MRSEIRTWAKNNGLKNRTIYNAVKSELSKMKHPLKRSITHIGDICFGQNHISTKLPVVYYRGLPRKNNIKPFILWHTMTGDFFYNKLDISN